MTPSNPPTPYAQYQQSMPKHATHRINLRRWILPNDPLDLILVRRAILLEEVVRISLGWRVGVGVIKQILNAEKNLLYGDRRFPALLFVQDRQADRARWINIRVEERWDKFA